MSSDGLAIRAERLSKRYALGERQRYRTLREALVDATRAPFRRRRTEPRETIWALRDVSFDIRHGEVVGVIGRNGAGKSTLLRILSRITEPTSGYAELHGRVGSLLEVGTGFHSELTGRENIYLSGAILGMRRAEIERKFDEIVAFAEVERFIDTPVKRYSSGMYLRLAFAVAAHLDPEILLVDEVLAVGDAEFQKRCLGKMGEVARSGRTVVFVSHNMGAIRRLCARGIWLDRGNLQLVDRAERAVDAYYAALTQDADRTSGEIDLSERVDRSGSGRARFLRVRMLSTSSVARQWFEFLEPFNIEFEVECHEGVAPVFVGITILADDGTSIVGTHDTDLGEPRALQAGKIYRACCKFNPNLLKPGNYFLQATISDATTWECHDWLYSVGTFRIDPGTGKFGRSLDRRPAYVQPILTWVWSDM